MTQVPDLPTDVHKIIRFTGSGSSPELLGWSLQDWMARRAPSDAFLLPELARLDVVDTTPIFCDGGRCLAGKDGVSYYIDNHHLSVEGARIVTRKILPLLGVSAETAGNG